ncbi:pilus assembly protein PilP [Methylotuvimicrobium buryatense]|uniref:Pilus assembly protein PilP n=1 Tax=Methylotuvimicrobium buryatense TaxID=95641 RepID=A0A4P9UKK0_METBY|nr:pilus assembly protein PilP [Methylotuvimicrobium buryatense]QCW81587.1 pilus assembly protein PilP [Methylotuvimicrobium buryatense]
MKSSILSATDSRSRQSRHGERGWFQHGAIAALGLLNLLLLSACSSDDKSDLVQYINQVKARPKTQIEPLPEIKVIEPFIYKPSGLRDPFRPIEKVVEAELVDVGTGRGIRPDPIRRKEQLESYSLDSLRMVGTITKDAVLWGLIKAGDGTIHRVRQGNFMGRNHGKIIRINEDKIELMEIVPDKPGTWREQQTSLALSE